MDATAATQLQKAMGLVPDPVLPSVKELLSQIVDGLKKLGDDGLGGSRDLTTRAHLAGIVSMINYEIKLRDTAAKITANNDAQAKLQAEKDARNKALAQAAGTLGALS